MMKHAYAPKKFSSDRMKVILQADAICTEYAAKGYDLTLRQLYYQFVARGLLPNEDRQYKRLGQIVSEARLAGFIDWAHLVDRTRSLTNIGHWEDPSDIIRDVAAAFRHDKWTDQNTRVEVWIEKEALAGVLAHVCPELDVPYFSCRGYVSQSEMWTASMRLARYIRDGAEEVRILHLGDHDPSGIDMTRDIRDRLSLFLGTARSRRLVVDRIALTMAQVEEYDPPPNPAKETDSRHREYMEQYGNESWELDALNPETLVALVKGHVMIHRQEVEWAQAVEHEDRDRELLTLTSDRWQDVTEFLEG